MVVQAVLYIFYSLTPIHYSQLQLSFLKILDCAKHRCKSMFNNL